MICRKCGFEVPEGTAFCTNCGEKVFFHEKKEPDFAGEHDPAPGSDPYKDSYERGAYPPPYSYTPVNDKAPTVKDYLKWMLLYSLLPLIPGVGLIIYIVLCVNHILDKTNVARSNYFKAIIITHIITVVIMVIIFVVFFGIFAGLMASGTSIFEEAYPEFFNEFAYSALRIFTGK